MRTAFCLIVLLLFGCDAKPGNEACRSMAMVVSDGNWLRCHSAARLLVERIGPEAVVAKCECPAVPEHAVVGPARVRDEGVSVTPAARVLVPGEGVRCYAVAAGGGLP